MLYMWIGIILLHMNHQCGSQPPPACIPSAHLARYISRGHGEHLTARYISRYASLTDDVIVQQAYPPSCCAQLADWRTVHGNLCTMKAAKAPPFLHNHSAPCWLMTILLMLLYAVLQHIILHVYPLAAPLRFVLRFAEDWWYCMAVLVAQHPSSCYTSLIDGVAHGVVGGIAPPRTACYASLLHE